MTFNKKKDFNLQVIVKKIFGKTQKLNKSTQLYF